MFITHTTQTQLETIREIIHNSEFSHCILISCISLDLVYLELNDGKDVSDIIATGKASSEATKQLEGMLVEWIGKKVHTKSSLFFKLFLDINKKLIILLNIYLHD